MVTETEVTQTMAILGDAVSIEFILSLVSLMENKYSGSLLLLKGYNRFDSKQLTLSPTEANVLQANPIRRAVRYRVISQAAALFFEINI
jgi:hypothetical protein